MRSRAEILYLSNNDRPQIADHRSVADLEAAKTTCSIKITSIGEAECVLTTEPKY